MIGQSELYSALNVTAITSLLTDYNGLPGLFFSSLIPQSFNGVETKAQDTTIIYYPAGNFNLALNYGQYPFYINCRAATFKTSRELAETVVANINRKGDGFFITCELQATIPPIDETDNHNTVVSITLKTK